MGQKINPTIFRLGVNKTWKTEFFEKKNHELPLYVFKDLEVRNYIERVLETYGIILHDYKQQYNGSTLNLYISYFVTSDFVMNKKENVQKLMIKDRTGNKKVVLNLPKSAKNLTYSLLGKPSINFSEDPSRLYKLKQYFNSSSSIKSSLKQNFDYEARNINESRTLNSKINGIFDQVFEVLNLFSNNKLNVALNLCCINKDLHFLKFSQEKMFMSLQKFRNTPFLKEGIEILFHVAYNSNSANLLAKFIAFQLKKIKRQKFFLSFLKQSLTVLSNSEPSKIKGVKIVIKGRLNGVPRAKHKIITIGDVPVQSISAKLDYSQTTIHNSNGSYGIQVWVVEK
uniref:Ribosomal protein S3 n=1 Tax=Pseudo-nitzschia micropora TaxID=186175 RepID=A0A888YP03_9STRA|nr:ribosomal protein S3 [Pseudo-nitzschia micropora]QRC76538.1 ribosomal protein S3 [Pseudo-nitzschia micropora]